MRNINVLVILLSLLIQSGCATQGVSSFNYTPPSTYKTENEKTIERGQSTVWDELVRELAKSFFVINNIERESRIINITFNSTSPESYVDCGRTRRVYTQGEKQEIFDYAVASRATFKAAGNTQPHPSQISYALINRVPSVEGRSNIYVAPDPSDVSKTIISVNTRYVFAVRVQGQMVIQDFAGNIVGQQAIPPRDNPPMIFNTNKPASQTESNVEVTCSGNGRLESEILRMVR